MNWTPWVVAACLLWAAPHSACAAASAQTPPMPGGYQPRDVADADVQEARAAIQEQLASMRIEEVQAAYVQVVAGLNFKLICRVSGDDGPSTWQFVIWRRLDGTWRLTEARRLQAQP